MSQLNYVTVGTGPTVLLLHPVGLDGSFWGDLPAALSSRYEVVAVDQAGHGRSPAAARPGRMERHVRDIEEIVRESGAPAVLVGVSFGGMLAQNVALSRPDLVSGLVLAGCPGEIPAAAREAIRARGRAAEEKGMEAVVEETLARWFTPGYLSTDEVSLVRDRLLRNAPGDFAATWEAVSEHAALPRLGALGVPALVIAGSEDAATPLAAKRALAGALPRGRLAVIEGAPHMMQIERAAEFRALVADFLAEVGR